MIVVRFWLAVWDRLGWLVRALGGDVQPFRALLETRLTLDFRRPPMGQPGGASRLSGFALNLGTFLLLGGFASLGLLAGGRPDVPLALIQAFLLLMLGITFLGDFAALVLDPTDLQLVGPCPVSGRTLLLARWAHVGSYLVSLSLSLAVGPMVVGTVRLGFWFAPLFLLTILLGLLLVVGFASLAYLLVLRFLGGERVRDVLVWCQLALSAAFVIGQQLFIRLVQASADRGLDLAEAGWAWAFPPAWLAAPIVLATGRGGAALWGLTALAAIAPVFSVFLVQRVLSPRFLDLLLRDAPAGERVDRERRSWWRRLGARCVARAGEERVGFDLTWSVASQDRQVKLRLYPALVFPVLFPVLGVFTHPAGPAAWWNMMTRSNLFLFFLYFPATAAVAAVMQCGYSEQHAASWVYDALPVGRPAAIVRGMAKAVFFRFALPVQLLVGMPFVIGGGVGLLDDWLLVAAVTACTTVLMALHVSGRLPFSEAPQAMASGGQTVRMLVGMSVFLVAGFVHAGLRAIPFGVPVALAILAVLVPLLGRLPGPARLAR
jgi:hypothetical protein